MAQTRPPAADAQLRCSGSMLFHLTPYAGRMRWALAPLRLMQRLGLDRLDREERPAAAAAALAAADAGDACRGCEPHYGRLPEVLPAEGKRRARVALFTRLRRRRLLPADEPGHGPRPAAQRLRGVDAARPGLLRRAALPRRPGGAGPGSSPRPTARCSARADEAGQVDAIIVNAGGCGAVLKEYGHLLDETPPPRQARVRRQGARHQRVPGGAGPDQAGASAADQGDLSRRLPPVPRPEDPPAAAAAAGA